MKDTLMNTANDLLVNMISAATVAGEFVIAEVPIILKQLLWWNAGEAVVDIITWIIALGVLMYTTKKTKAWNAKAKEDDVSYDAEMNSFICLIISSVVLALVGVFGFFEAMEEVKTIAKILIAPDLYLLEYGADLLKTVSN